MARVMAMPDMHFPFQHKDSIDFLSMLAEAYECDTFVNLGDLLDFYSVSDYKSDPSAMSAGAEYIKAIEQVGELYEYFPYVLACYGNHDLRIQKKAYNAGIPEEFLKDFNEVIHSPDGWDWQEEHIVDGVLYLHGNGYSGVYATRHMLMSKMQSVVHGHTHALAGVMHMQVSPTKDVYGMNAGCLADPVSYAMAYAKNARTKPSLGAGIILDGIPFWIPMQLTKSGKRWNGEIV
jgi:predicted phosphodiesterase